MRYQDMIIEATARAAEEFFRYARAVTEERLEWKPLDAGRSVLDLAREAAMTPDWARESLESDASPEWNDEKMAEQKRLMDSWTAIHECESQCLRRLEKFYATVRDFPDDRLTATKWLPYEGGRDFTFAEMMDYPRWNFNYHTGQVAYIQTLYGDKEMY